VVFDADKAGVAATERSIGVLLAQGLSVRVPKMLSPDGSKVDPDLFVQQHGADAFRQMLNNSNDWIQYLAERYKTATPEERKNLATEDKAAFVSNAKSLIAGIPNLELREQYVSSLAEYQKVSKNISIKQKPKNFKTNEITQETPQVPCSTFPTMELRFVNLVLKNECLWQIFHNLFDPSLFESAFLAEFLDHALLLFEETGTIDVKILYERLPSIQQEFLAELSVETWTQERALFDFWTNYILLRIRKIERELPAAKAQKELDLWLELNKKMRQWKSLHKRLIAGENVKAELEALLAPSGESGGAPL
jgi:DNA primase